MLLYVQWDWSQNVVMNIMLAPSKKTTKKVIFLLLTNLIMLLTNPHHWKNGLQWSMDKISILPEIKYGKMDSLPEEVHNTF